VRFVYFAFYALGFGMRTGIMALLTVRQKLFERGEESVTSEQSMSTKLAHY
jgi:hypothetical protein